MSIYKGSIKYGDKVLLENISLTDAATKVLKIKDKYLLSNIQLIISDWIPTTYDKTLYTESDGSKWVRVFHHNNPASNLFSSSDNFNGLVYKSADMWYDMQIITNYTTYEFMVKQKDTSSSSEIKYRWVQPYTCFDTLYDHAVASLVTHNTSSGYDTTTTYGGLYLGHGDNANGWILINNGNKGNWWGCVGCNTAYQGGIPGYPQHVCTTGYFDIYFRID